VAKPDIPDSRERLLGAAVDLLRAKSPSSSGTAEILRRAHAPRGSFYFHFPEGKEQLVAEAVDRHADATQKAMADALANRSVPIGPRVEAMVNDVADALVADHYVLGCAVGSTALEAATISERLRTTTQTAFAGWSEMIAGRLHDEGIATAHAAELADAIVAGLEGGTMVARVSRDPTQLRHVASALGVAVAAYAPQRHA
jgi:TetR/AcrR family transcriptional repressor of lmrAB and yxaGH operons